MELTRETYLVIMISAQSYTFHSFLAYFIEGGGRYGYGKHYHNYPSLSFTHSILRSLPAMVYTEWNEQTALANVSLRLNLQTRQGEHC